MFKSLFGKKRRSITIAPTWAARDNDTWRFTLRIWASKERQKEVPSWAVQVLVDDKDGLTAEEKKRLATTVADFIVDDDSGEEITFQFPGDPEENTFGFENRTDFNGIVIGDFSLADGRVGDIAKQQGAADSWLTIEARGKDGVTGTGHIKLLQPNGRSVVSDIDDTIRVTEIPKGRATVLRTTFLEPFVAVPGMRARYGAYGNAVDFHYVSGGPWQLYRVLAPFLIDETGFPAGTFHMRTLPKSPFEEESWRAWRDLVGGESTIEHKKAEITALIRACPGRRFILIGDSGEKDPEIYKGLRESFPDRIEAILIRDVSREAGSERLSTLTVIPP